jgi:hypothetical protein
MISNDPKRPFQATPPNGTASVQPKPKRTGSSRATAKELRELRALIAGLVRERYATDEYYEKLLVIYRRVETDLENRERFQRLARSPRYKRDPEAFCRWLWKKSPAQWRREFDSLWSQLTSKKVQTLRALFTRDPESLTHPEMFKRYDPSSLEEETRTVLGMFQSLAARKPGRKRTKADLYAKALKLRSQKPRPTVHQIVMKLSPDYKTMSSSRERRVERDRWQAGIARARRERDAIASHKG